MAVPYLAYYLTSNPDFGKTFTLNDIPKPSRETYEYACSDWMTLGRQIPEFEVWQQRVQENDLKTKLESSKCQVQMERFSVLDEDDLTEKLKAFDPLKVRFHDTRIQAKFLEVHSV